MTEEDIRSLLYVTEGTTLDFKRDQYPFAKATDEQKSEILKDLLGFANAWRKETAYILVGVEEGKGGPAIVHGITASDHLDDHSLQQFVHGKTSKPVRFHYRACQFEGKQVGVFEIEADHPRPVYLLKDFGKLAKNAVYVRRGSCTDPQSPASPDEMAQMGKVETAQSAEIVVTFCETDRDFDLGAAVTLEAEYCKVPKDEKIPSLEEPPGPFGLSLSSPFQRLNADYLRDLAFFEFVHRLYRPVRFCVANVGTTNAEQVRVELIIPFEDGMLAAEEFDIPSPPERVKPFPPLHVPPKVRPKLLQPGAITVDRGDDHCRIEFDCGTLQPGRKIRTDSVFVAYWQSAEVSVRGLVYAASLRQPATFSLLFRFDIEESALSVAGLKALAKEAR